MKINQNLLLAFCLCLALTPQSGRAEVVPGDTSTLQGAVFLATNVYPNKMILLVVSDTNTCSACRALASTGFPSTNPPVFQFLRELFVFWPCGADEHCTAYQQWLGTGIIPVPQLLMINPRKTATFSSSSAGYGGADGLFNTMRLGLLRGTAPYVTSLEDASNPFNHLDITLENWQKTNTVAFSNIVVQGHSISTNVLLYRVKYKLDTTNGWTSLTISNTTAWEMPLNSAQIVSGKNVLRFYATDINLTGSQTNVFPFIYSANGTPVASETVTTVSSWQNPSVYGQAVAFTATVSGAGGTPTGTVTFKDGSTTLGAGTLNSGQATFSLSSLSAGSHSIMAQYAGDGTFGASTGTLSGGQTVNKATVNITANDDSKTYGQTKTYGAGSAAFMSSGLQNSETIGTVTLAVSGNGGAATAAVGSYIITPSAATGGTFTAGNYTIFYSPGTLTVNSLVPGDTNGNGIVDQAELNAVLAHYWASSPPYISNTAIAGKTNFTFTITNFTFTVQFTTNLANPNWQNLGQARFQFTDPNAVIGQQRYYRLVAP